MESIQSHPAGGHQWTLDPESQTWVCAIGGEPAAPEQTPAIEQDERDAEDARAEAETPNLTLEDHARCILSDARDREDDKSLTTGDVAVLSGDEAEIRKWWTPNSDPDDETTEADLAAALRAGEMVRSERTKAGEVHDVVMLPGADGPEQYDRSSDHPRKHPFEAGPGSSGRVCTRMVLLDDGSGDECGATPAEHGPTLAEAVAAEDPFDEDGSETFAPAGLSWLEQIQQAQSKADLRAIRSDAMVIGQWTAELTAAGLERIKVLAQQG